MATVPDLIGQVSSAILAMLPAGSKRYDSDYRDDLEKIQSGQTRYQVRGLSSGTTGDSNTIYKRATVELAVHFALSGTERAYTEGAMATQLASILTLSWWRALAAVHEITTEDAPQLVAQRVGSVFTYTVTASVTLKP